MEDFDAICCVCCQYLICLPGCFRGAAADEGSGWINTLILGRGSWLNPCLFHTAASFMSVNIDIP